jgi:hypothetical protein
VTGWKRKWKREWNIKRNKEERLENLFFSAKLFYDIKESNHFFVHPKAKKERMKKKTAI